VFDTLIESKRKRDGKRLFGVGLVSLLVHAVVITGAVVATWNIGQSNTTVKVDTAMVYLNQPQQQQKPPEQHPVQLDVPLKGFQTVVAPSEIPTTIPPINLEEHFNPKDYSGTGVEGGVADGIVPTGDVYAESVVEEKPDRLAGPQPTYPEMLRQAGIQGRVVVQVVIDTTGKAEPSTLRIIQSPNPGFNEVVKNSVLHTLFRPGRVHGRAVKVLVELPFDFKIH
jgi:periplasmic protein TonB